MVYSRHEKWNKILYVIGKLKNISCGSGDVSQWKSTHLACVKPGSFPEHHRKAGHQGRVLNVDG